MSGYLPYGGFQWLKNVANFDANSFSEKSLIGYILEVDLEYPNEMHYLHYVTLPLPPLPLPPFHISRKTYLILI